MKTIPVKLPGFAVFEVQVSGPPSENEAQFYSDLADAVIAAFESRNLG